MRISSHFQNKVHKITSRFLWNFILLGAHYNTWKLHQNRERIKKFSIARPFFTLYYHSIKDYFPFYLPFFFSILPFYLETQLQSMSFFLNRIGLNPYSSTSFSRFLFLLARLVPLSYDKKSEKWNLRQFTP